MRKVMFIIIVLVWVLNNSCSVTQQHSHDDAHLSAAFPEETAALSGSTSISTEDEEHSSPAISPSYEVIIYIFMIILLRTGGITTSCLSKTVGILF